MSKEVEFFGNCKQSNYVCSLKNTETDFIYQS